MSKAERGRPSTYTQEVADAICELMSTGRSLRAVCRLDDMPSESTVRSWALDDREGFFAQYTRARALQAHALFDQTLEIADDGTNDTYVDGDGNDVVDHDVLQRSRLRVDTRKWYLSKVLPKVYGDKVAMEHSGPGGGPIETRDLSDDELKARSAQLRNRLLATTPHTNGTNGAH